MAIEVQPFQENPNLVQLLVHLQDLLYPRLFSKMRRMAPTLAVNGMNEDCLYNACAICMILEQKPPENSMFLPCS